MIFKNKIVRNASWIIGARIAQAILSLIVSSLTARFLGPSNYGLIGYAQSIVTFVVPIMQLGLNAVLVQEIIRNPQDEGKILGTSLVMTFVSAIVCGLGVLSFVACVNAGEKETFIVCALYSLVLLCQSTEIIQYWFQAKYLSKYTSLLSLGAYILVSVYKIVLLVLQKNVYWFAVSYAIDYFLIAVGMHIIYRKLGGQVFSFSKKYALDLIAKGKYYILSGLMVAVFAQTDRIMLKLMVGDAETGLYSAAVVCAGLASFFFSAIIDSMRPAAVEQKGTSEKGYKNVLTQLYSIVIYCALAYSLFATVFAKPIISILYGREYSRSVPVLRVIVWYTTFSYFGGAKDVWILTEGKQKYLLLLNATGAFANVLLNYFLISVWGAVGAAVASLVTQFFANVVMMVIIPELRPNAVLLLQATNPKVLFDMLKHIGGKKHEPI